MKQFTLWHLKTNKEDFIMSNKFKVKSAKVKINSIYENIVNESLSLS